MNKALAKDMVEFLVKLYGEKKGVEIIIKEKKTTAN